MGNDHDRRYGTGLWESLAKLQKSHEYLVLPVCPEFPPAPQSSLGTGAES